MFSSSYLLALIRPSTWKLQPDQSTFPSNTAWSNKDMDPVPPHLQTWTTLSYITFWISCAANVTVWELASSMIAIGLSWYDFPSFIILSMFWFGVQTFIGSECVYQMLKAIWPSIAHLPNHLPPSAKITSVELICYFLYWCFQLPFMFVSPHKIRWLFLAKTIVVPPTLLALLVWAAVKVPLNSSLLSQRSALSGSELSWAWLGAVNSSLGIFSQQPASICRILRYAKNERAQYAQLIVIPAAITLASFVGIAVTSAGMTLYGQVLWDPLKLIDRWDNRACAFFASLAFLLSTLSANISANSLRQVICAFLGGWVFCPWKVLASAPGFLSFLSGYTVFIGPITAGFFSIGLYTRTRVDVPAMYRPHGRYRYTYGGGKSSQRAVLLISVLPTFPGLIHSINASVRAPDKYTEADYVVHPRVDGLLRTVKMFPANETILDRAIVDLEVPPSDGRASGGVEKGDVRVDETSVA
ncbi:NCS1 nucleoside transporter family [Lactarius hengduanensis]|nr:NCS1 nucleoside transporter family [Lactarius hengduanensis]